MGNFAVISVSCLLDLTKLSVGILFLSQIFLLIELYL